MILIDTGPLVALFEPRDHNHLRCSATLGRLVEPLFTTIPVLTEAFHLLRPDSRGADWLREFITRGGLSMWFMDRRSLERAFELMRLYSDHPMDFADASLVAAAESLNTRRVFTIDRNDFESYRAERGRRSYPFEVFC